MKWSVWLLQMVCVCLICIAAFHYHDHAPWTYLLLFFGIVGLAGVAYFQGTQEGH